jgi:hypothetical protein
VPVEEAITPAFRSDMGALLSVAAVPDRGSVGKG